MGKREAQIELDICQDLTNLPDEGEYWPLPLYVTRQTPGRPSVTRSSGIMGSIRSVQKTSLSCLRALFKRAVKKH